MYVFKLIPSAPLIRMSWNTAPEKHKLSHKYQYFSISNIFSLHLFYYFSTSSLYPPCSPAFPLTAGSPLDLWLAARHIYAPVDLQQRERTLCHLQVWRLQQHAWNAHPAVTDTHINMHTCSVPANNTPIGLCIQLAETYTSTVTNMHMIIIITHILCAT